MAIPTQDSASNMPAYLPPELWLCVAESLYNEYQEESPRLDSDFPSTTSAALVALANLCRVSTSLNHIATPLLYRLPFTKKVSSLLDTLTSCPELSRHVQKLNHRLWRLERPTIDFGIFPAAFHEAFERKREFVRQNHCDYDIPDWVEEELADGVFDDQIAYATLVSLLPNLVSVSLVSSLRYVCVGLESGSLPNLALAWIIHVDDQYLLEPCQLKYLAEAAPNIAHLHLVRFGMEEIDSDLENFPLFPNVTSLAMESSAVKGVSWYILLKAFPHLETLEYGVFDPNVEGRGGFARDIQAALLIDCPKLKRLCVDFSWVERNDMVWDVDRGFDHKLTSLRELEYLITDLSCIGSPELGDGGKGDEEDGELNLLLGEEDWIDLGLRSEALPASLRGLRIIVWDIWGWGKLVESLLDLAMKAPTQLPALEKVSILRPESTYKWDDKIMDAWKDTGVEMTLETSLSTWDSKSTKDWEWP